MSVAWRPDELPRRARAVAIGTFDGVHLGHRRVLDAAVAAADGGARAVTAVTFHPHPRTVLGNHVELLSTLERRLELLADAGVEDVLVVEFTPELAQVAPDDFVDAYLRAIGAEVVVTGETFRFGHRRAGDLTLLQRLGLEVRPVPILEGASSSQIRALVRGGEVERAAVQLGRPAEVDGVVVAGDARGGNLGYPTANLRVDPDLLVPAYGIYAGWAWGARVRDGRRAAISIGVNPHYGGSERRIEPYLLDFDGDLYGERLVVELWQRLRDERAFRSEEELVAQIARDVEATRAAERPP